MEDIRIQKFAEKIMRINAPSAGVVPGSRLGAGVFGGMSSGAELFNQLKVKTNAFLRAYQAKNSAAEQLAKDIEGILMGLCSMAVIGEKEAKGLIDDLYDLLEEKSSGTKHNRP